MAYDNFDVGIFGAAVGAVVALVTAAVIYDDDLKLAKQTRLGVRYEAACVRDFDNGWSFDKCKQKALEETAVAMAKLRKCQAVFERPEFDAKDIEVGCGSSSAEGRELLR